MFLEKHLFGSFFVNFLILGRGPKMAAPRQCFFDTFNGQGPRSAWGHLETISSLGGSACWALQAGAKSFWGWGIPRLGGYVRE